ncbi:MAG: RNA polymerase sigma factor [Bacteroidetes bacterium]|nr:MAG: RNA polymerase sigma factor [Bacteroidota bacterium]
MTLIKEIVSFTDEELVRKIAKTRDTTLFEELYNRYAKIVYNKCFNFTNQYAVAEDLTHDIFLKLYLSVHQFSGKSKFSTWLYSFTYNFCVNYVTRNTEYKLMTDSVEIEERNLPAADFDDSMIYNMQVEKLEKALEKISPHQKMILLLKYQDDVSIKELQDYLGIGESAVKMRLMRAKADLLEIYNTLGHEY